MEFDEFRRVLEDRVDELSPLGSGACFVREPRSGLALSVRQVGRQSGHATPWCSHERRE